MEDLARLGDDLPLLLRVAVLEEDVDLGEGVEGDRVRVDAGLLGGPRDVGPDLGLELGDRLAAGAGDRLVGVDDDALEADGVAEGHERRHELHRAAVRVGDDPLVGLEVVRVDLADDERDARLHPPGARVVDDGAAAGGRLRRQLARDRAAGREEGDVDALEGLGRRLLHLDLAAVEREGRPGRACRGEEADLPDREAALDEDRGHRAADDAGGADDGDGEGTGGVSGHGSAFRAREDERAPPEYSSAPGAVPGALLGRLRGRAGRPVPYPLARCRCIAALRERLTRPWRSTSVTTTITSSPTDTTSSTDGTW